MDSNFTLSTIRKFIYLCTCVYHVFFSSFCYFKTKIIGFLTNETNKQNRLVKFFFVLFFFLFLFNDFEFFAQSFLFHRSLRNSWKIHWNNNKKTDARQKLAAKNHCFAIPYFHVCILADFFLPILFSSLNTHFIILSICSIYK